MHFLVPDRHASQVEHFVARVKLRLGDSAVLVVHRVGNNRLRGVPVRRDKGAVHVHEVGAL